MDVIRVMVVDDHDVVREGLAGFLNAFDDLELVGEARDGKAALTLCGQVQPDVILMDIVMPVLDGIEATRQILARYPQAKIVILTSFSDEANVLPALQAGALSYLLKNASIHEVARVIRAAYAGESTLAPDVAQTLIQSKVRPPAPTYNLTERELVVLALMIEGQNNPQIAAQLYLSRSTVKFHVSAILAKLSVSSRTEAVGLAVEQGLVPRE
jgi:two-component system, NarL family, response regulator LiaR